MPDSTPALAHKPPSPESLIYPLTEFYTRAGLPLPKIEVIPADSVPEPCKSLLVHASDMTPTLEKFHNSAMHLDILNRERHGVFYFREVILRLNSNEQAVEFGANKIHLACFSDEAQFLILEEQVPLGRILKECEVQHRTEAKAFLRLESDAVMQQAFGLEKPTTLYGRKAVISDPQGRALSEIVEILPPAPPAG